MNIVILSGNLGQDPQIRYTAQGVPVAQFSMAVNYVKGDEKRTNWINVVAFRKQAELVVDYLKKGSRVAIEGTLRTRTWTDPNGINRKIVEVVARRIEFLSPKKTEEATPDVGQPDETPPPPDNGDVVDDDIPF